MTDRKLASIRRVDAVEPIDGADNIEVLVIGGWQTITQKSNGFKAGDAVVFFEVDSFLPVCEKFEFLRKSGYRNTSNLGEGFRLKTMKMRGVLSQGLALPMSEFPDVIKFENVDNRPYPVWIAYNTRDEDTGVFAWGPYVEKTPVWDTPDGVWKPKAEVSGYEYDFEGGAIDLTEALGVKLYEKPLPPAQGSMRMKGNFPMWIRKTDQERIQNIQTKALVANLDSDFEVTMKLDGMSMTAYVKDGVVGVCSRNWEIETDAEGRDGAPNAYNALSERVGLKFALEAVCMSKAHPKPRNLALQGELVGPGCNGNHDGLNRLELYVFDIWDIDEQKYLGREEREWFLACLRPCLTPGEDIKTVPYLGTTKLRNISGDVSVLRQKLLEYAVGPSLNPARDREGLVFKRLDGQFSFKAISNQYLLKEKD